MLEREVAGIRCVEVLAALSDHLDDELSASARARIEGHVRACAECLRFGGVFATMIAALREPTPMPDDVAARLAARLATLVT
jgi:anti-sigma factor RsiW